MTNPVGRSSSSPPSNPNPNQPPEGSLWGRIGSFLKEIFSRYPQPEPSPATFSSDVSSKEVGLSKDVILRRWVNSQPKNAKWEVVAIIDILGRINLDDALALHLRNYVPPFYLDEWNGREFSAFQDFQKEFVQDAINHFLEPYPQSIIEIIQGLTALSPKERMPLKTAIEKWEQCEQSD